MAESPPLARPRHRAGRRPRLPGGLLAATVAVAGVALIGGGTAAAAATTARPAHHHAAARRLCLRPAATDRVSITASTPSHPSRSVMVTRSPGVRSLASALCGLPRLPAGTECPAIASGFYRLAFTAGRHHLPAVTVSDSGCRLVAGLAAVRQADKARFWKLMKQLMTKRAAPRHVFVPWHPGHLPWGACGTPVLPRLPMMPMLPMMPVRAWLPPCIGYAGPAGSRVWM
jgi:hypothetical protein